MKLQVVLSGGIPLDGLNGLSILQQRLIKSTALFAETELSFVRRLL